MAEQNTTGAVQLNVPADAAPNPLLTECSQIQQVLRQLAHRLAQDQVAQLTIDYDGSEDTADFTLRLFDEYDNQLTGDAIPLWAQLANTEAMQLLQPMVVQIIEQYTQALGIGKWATELGGHGTIVVHGNGTYVIEHHTCHLSSERAGLSQGNAWRNCPAQSDTSSTRLH